MNFQSKTAAECLSALKSEVKGLTSEEANRRLQQNGYNELSEKPEKGLFARIFSALKEPMLLILLFGFMITLGANIGKAIRTGDGDFTECFGILAAVILSVSITLIMEGSSRKAFLALKKISAVRSVKVYRDGKPALIPVKEIVKGDLVLFESGDKIVADGRLITSEELTVDESALTGESRAIKKDANAVLAVNTHLAERVNCVYSGTFVTAGRGAMVATAVGNDTEMGKIAGELTSAYENDSPLNKKLAKLGKTVTVLGAIAATIVFVFSVFRLIYSGNLNFDGVSDAFISCIVLIVAAVPEGLPTIVAMSLALNMIRLAKEKTLIKKMIATETAGAVSVICSDKTGTLTENKMTVVAVCAGDVLRRAEEIEKDVITENFVLNSTAEKTGGKNKFIGNGTECALLSAAEKVGVSTELRKRYRVLFRLPFSSEKKYMMTAVEKDNIARVYLKGAPEKVLDFCDLTRAQKARILSGMETHQKNARRILAFAHFDEDGEDLTSEKDIRGKFIFDGYCALADPVRADVKEAVEDCKKAGIKVKMLTGDNPVTALAVARELGIAKSASEAVTSSDIESMTDEQLCAALKKIAVIARSTPTVKYRVVKALKKIGEVVAVTGDGINDAPAIRHADVGIAMGESGSEIAKEAADVVLIDDGFKNVVKAVEFGRNVYRNIQRFILFQLSVNVAALIFITACAILGTNMPFNTLQLLWINVIMDGPPALTLGLEPPSTNLMRFKPVKRSEPIVNRKTFLRILFNGIFVGVIMIYQHLYNFLGASEAEKNSTTFTLFIFFQLFNAFNCRELGDVSIFRNFGRNKIMLATFVGVFLTHFVIVQALYKPFGLRPMSFALWLKCAGVALTIVVVSECYKWIYRAVKDKLPWFFGRKGGAKQVSARFINKNRGRA